MELWIVDSYTKVFKDSIKPNHSLETIKFDCAKNEYESAQIVLKGNEDFTIHGVDFSDLSNLKHVISNKHLKYNYQDFIVFNDGIHYPDPLLNSTSIHVLKNESQSIWVTCFIPKETPAGDYKGMVTIHTSRGDYDVEIETTVYAVTIPEPKAGNLSLEYWTFFVGSWYHSYDSFNVIEKQYGYKKYSREWWDLLEQTIDHMKEHRINMILVRTQDLLLDAGTTIDDNGKYTFNWSLFDQYIERFMNKDMVKRLVGFQLVEQCHLAFVHVINKTSEGEMTITNEEPGSIVAENWLDQFLPALKLQLEEKKWLSIWIQHIADEPNHRPQNWISTREKVKRYLPEVKSCEPLDNMSFNDDFTNHLDIWVPRIELFDEKIDFFKERQKNGDEVWLYSCCLPFDECFLNKFIDRPIWHNRLISWGCFKHGVSGFLHWGYNYWDSRDKNFGYTPDAHFKGDGFIVYPDPLNKTIKNSARFIATRDGIEDYELFKILERINPIKAYQIVNSIFTNFSYFSANINRMKEMRKELLIACSLSKN